LAEHPDQRTFEDERADLYWRMHWHPIFEGRRKLKGPIDRCTAKSAENDARNLTRGCDESERRVRACRCDFDASWLRLSVNFAMLTRAFNISVLTSTQLVGHSPDWQRLNPMSAS
jgi:hypothetical protein